MVLDGQQPFLHQKLCRTLTYIDQKPCRGPSESCNSGDVSDSKNNTTDVFSTDNSINFQNKNLYRYATSKSITKPHFNTQPIRSSNQFSSGSRSNSQFQSQRKFSSCSEINEGGYCVRDSELNYSPNARIGNGSDRLSLKGKQNMLGELQAMADLTCGPRRQRRNMVLNIQDVDERTWLSVRREEYNLEDFKIEYDSAKFYVIKPISEDDTHKSIKYNVWSSTPYGNKKLDTVFRDSHKETSNADTICPIFLFYSVNGSGQFVGLAEMIGKVDFAKNLNFWQTEEWNGFFPVRWHIIKDIPNIQLRHIIIENNDNEPVTHTRDTKEIGFQHGLEMLKIFKNYTAKTSLLDDINFYENREHSLRAKRNRNNMAVTRTEKQERAVERTTRGFATNNFSDSTELIICRTQKLSIHVTRQ
ncbi:YTH domain-containing protein ECT3-like isoform X2 [Apium graveolens]|uniref:YTH domain-containing protein ECT3-like isoform X2 n=1 Tax=Apium graveolens TaxID=4045 RepID=UPI003D7A3E53